MGWLRASWVHGLALAIVFMFGLVAQAAAETRTLKLHFIHTKETAEIAYKRNGRYLPDGLKKINRFLRDWRRNEPTKMDPQLLDVVWEIYRTAGARQPIHVVSAYRSPATNSLLRSRSKGVAKKSQHMLGKAMDFYIPGVSLSKLRASALRIQAGGVGYYPRSGSPFIHVDVGNVRHWPRMSRRELLAVFPDGKTIHVPTDGKPLPGFEQALASYEKRRSSGSLATAGASRSKGFFATLFGGGADEEEDIAVAEAPRAAPARRKPEPQVAVAEEAAPAVRTRAGETLPGVPAVAPTPPPAAVPEPEPEPAPDTPETIIAALPARSVPVPLVAPRPQVDVGPTVAVAEAAEQAGVPAATALASAAPIPPAEPAPGIPLPSRRPDYTAPAIAVAAAEPPMPETVAAALVPAPRPTTGERALAQAFGANAVPASRPASPIDAVLDDALRTADADADTVLEATPAPVLAAAAAAAAPSASASADVSPPAAKVAEVQPEPVQPKPLTVAALAPATPRSALLERKAEEIRPRVKTTEKSGKPKPGARRDEPKPQVVPSEPSDARWAFDRHSVTQNTRGTLKPSFAYNLVRTAPRTVYTAGFSSGSGQGSANGFSGKAVTFLPVARFDQD